MKIDVAKTAIFHSHEQPMELKDIPIPVLKPGELLIKIEHATLCRSDLNTFCGKRFEATPTILGHEMMGTLIKFGPDSPQVDLAGQVLQIGDRLSWAIFASDPDSELAQKGIPQKAIDKFKYGHEPLTPSAVLHGGLSQFIILRPHTPIIKISPAIPSSVASIINCAVATVSGALRLAGEIRGKRVLVSGVGMLGIVACAMCQTQGAKDVIALDNNEARLETAKSFGSTLQLRADDQLGTTLQRLYGKKNPIDLVLEFSGITQAMENTLQVLDFGGTAIWVGATHPQPELRLNAEQIVRHLWTIKGLHNYNRKDFIHAVSFMEKHHADFPFPALIHDAFTLDQVNEAFAYALAVNPYRVGIKIS